MTKRPLAGADGNSALGSFTLVEVLVSIAVLSILIVILLSMLGSLTTAWQLGQAHNERRNVAQAVFDRMSRDLTVAALPMPRTNTNSLQLIINPSTVSTNYQYGQSIFWQAPVATDGGTNGNLAVVGYFVQWVNGSAGSPGTPCLSRVLINPSAPDYAVYSSPNNWINDALIQKYAPATSASGYAGLLAENVLGLWVQALDPMGNSIMQTNSTPNSTIYAGESFDSRYPYTYGDYNYSAVPAVTNIPCALPASIQVALAVIDSRTAQRLTVLGGGKTPTYPTLSGNFWKDVQGFYNGLLPPIKQGTEIVSITIPLAGGPRP